MKISLRRLPNGDPAFQRMVLRADGRDEISGAAPHVRPVKTPVRERTSFIAALLGEKGRAIVARINPRFRRAKLSIVKVQS